KTQAPTTPAPCANPSMDVTHTAQTPTAPRRDGSAARAANEPDAAEAAAAAAREPAKQPRIGCDAPPLLLTWPGGDADGGGGGGDGEDGGRGGIAAALSTLVAAAGAARAAGAGEGDTCGPAAAAAATHARLQEPCRLLGASLGAEAARAVAGAGGAGGALRTVWREALATLGPGAAAPFMPATLDAALAACGGPGSDGGELLLMSFVGAVSDE
ncbi:hypothetical protein MNEG_14664, partial [Monoraphidium neglectum]